MSDVRSQVAVRYPIGSVVKLKSGSCAMTVVGYFHPRGEEPAYVDVMWFDVASRSMLPSQRLPVDAVYPVGGGE